MMNLAAFSKSILFQPVVEKDDKSSEPSTCRNSDISSLATVVSGQALNSKSPMDTSRLDNSNMQSVSKHALSVSFQEDVSDEGLLEEETAAVEVAEKPEELPAKRKTQQRKRRSTVLLEEAAAFGAVPTTHRGRRSSIWNEKSKKSHEVLPRQSIVPANPADLAREMSVPGEAASLSGVDLNVGVEHDADEMGNPSLILAVTPLLDEDVNQVDESYIEEIEVAEPTTLRTSRLRTTRQQSEPSEVVTVAPIVKKINRRSMRRSVASSVDSSQSEDDFQDAQTDVPAIEVLPDKKSTRRSMRQSTASSGAEESVAEKRSTRRSMRQSVASSVNESKSEDEIAEAAVEAPAVEKKSTRRATRQSVASSMNKSKSEDDIAEVASVVEKISARRATRQSVATADAKEAEPSKPSRRSMRQSVASSVNESNSEDDIEEVAVEAPVVEKQTIKRATRQSVASTVADEAVVEKRTTRRSMRQSVASSVNDSKSEDDVEEVAVEAPVMEKKSTRRSMRQSVASSVAEEPEAVEKSTRRAKRQSVASSVNESKSEDVGEVTVEAPVVEKKSTRRSMRHSVAGSVNESKSEDDIAEVAVEAPVVETKPTKRATRQSVASTVADEAVVEKRTTRRSMRQSVASSVNDSKSEDDVEEVAVEAPVMEKKSTRRATRQSIASSVDSSMMSEEADAETEKPAKRSARSSRSSAAARKPPLSKKANSPNISASSVEPEEGNPSDTGILGMEGGAVNDSSDQLEDDNSMDQTQNTSVRSSKRGSRQLEKNDVPLAALPPKRPKRTSAKRMKASEASKTLAAGQIVSDYDVSSGTEGAEGEVDASASSSDLAVGAEGNAEATCHAMDNTMDGVSPIKGAEDDDEVDMLVFDTIMPPEGLDDRNDSLTAAADHQDTECDSAAIPDAALEKVSQPEASVECQQCDIGDSNDHDELDQTVIVKDIPCPDEAPEEESDLRPLAVAATSEDNADIVPTVKEQEQAMVTLAVQSPGSIVADAGAIPQAKENAQMTKKSLGEVSDEDESLDLRSLVQKHGAASKQVTSKQSSLTPAIIPQTAPVAAETSLIATAAPSAAITVPPVAAQKENDNDLEALTAAPPVLTAQSLISRLQAIQAQSKTHSERTPPTVNGNKISVAAAAAVATNTMTPKLTPEVATIPLTAEKSGEKPTESEKDREDEEILAWQREIQRQQEMREQERKDLETKRAAEWREDMERRLKEKREQKLRMQQQQQTALQTQAAEDKQKELEVEKEQEKEAEVEKVSSMEGSLGGIGESLPTSTPQPIRQFAATMTPIMASPRTLSKNIAEKVAIFEGENNQDPAAAEEPATQAAVPATTVAASPVLNQASLEELASESTESSSFSSSSSTQPSRVVSAAPRQHHTLPSNVSKKAADLEERQKRAEEKRAALAAATQKRLDEMRRREEDRRKRELQMLAEKKRAAEAAQRKKEERIEEAEKRRRQEETDRQARLATVLEGKEKEREKDRKPENHPAAVEPATDLAEKETEDQMLSSETESESSALKRKSSEMEGNGNEASQGVPVAGSAKVPRLASTLSHVVLTPVKSNVVASSDGEMEESGASSTFVSSPNSSLSSGVATGLGEMPMPRPPARSPHANQLAHLANGQKSAASASALSSASVASALSSSHGAAPLRPAVGGGGVQGPVASPGIAPDHDSDSNDDSSDDEQASKNRKSPPSWAKASSLMQLLCEQQHRDPDHVFHPVTGCDLEEVFAKDKKFHRRTSSGNWFPDRVTWKEELAYKKQMGYKR